jgi:hypothetical protein
VGAIVALTLYDQVLNLITAIENIPEGEEKQMALRLAEWLARRLKEEHHDRDT